MTALCDPVPAQREQPGDRAASVIQCCTDV